MITAVKIQISVVCFVEVKTIIQILIILEPLKSLFFTIFQNEDKGMGYLRKIQADKLYT